MIFTKIPLEGNAYIIDIEPFKDYRGIFARTACLDEFENLNLNGRFIQQSLSFNPKAGTLRGMHWQIEPYSEEKLVRVTRGSIFDVIVDLNRESKTFKKWYSIELSEDNQRQIYIPKGFAHGFQTLRDNTEVLYQMTVKFKQEASKGFHWADPNINIDWPIIKNRIIGIRDTEFENFKN